MVGTPAALCASGKFQGFSSNLRRANAGKRSKSLSPEVRVNLTWKIELGAISSTDLKEKIKETEMTQMDLFNKTETDSQA